MGQFEDDGVGQIDEFLRARGEEGVEEDGVADEGREGGKWQG